jgi:hypothetical protein
MNCTNIKISVNLNTDRYNVGHNVLFQVKPTSMHGRRNFCTTAGCVFNLNDDCPEDLKVKVDNNVIACRSSCLAYNTDEYCCRGFYKHTCAPSPSAVYFKGRCPDILSFDQDSTGKFFCANTNYNIFFE